MNPSNGSNATEALARAQFDKCYNDLLYRLITFQLITPTANQTPRLVTPQEFIDNVCRTQEQQDSILQERTTYLKSIPFPTVEGQPLMIKPYKLYVTSPEFRKTIFETLKHLYVHALHGPSLTGVAERIQQNAANQQRQQHAAFMAQSQPQMESGNHQSSAGPNSFEDVMSSFLPAEISHGLSNEVQELFRDPAMAQRAPNLNDPADLFEFAQSLMTNPRIIAICDKANAQMEANGQCINEEGLQNMANKGKDALASLGAGEAAMFAPILQGLFKNGGVAADVDPNDPGVMEIVMRTLKSQKEKGKASDLAATLSIIARDYTEPKERLNDDDIANMSPEDFAKIQAMMQAQGGAMDIDGLENDLEMD